MEIMYTARMGVVTGGKVGMELSPMEIKICITVID